MTTVLQWVGILLIGAGALLTMITGLGMLRLRSLFARMHAATKPQVLGLVIMCLGLAALVQNPRVAATLSLVVVMQFVVAPISAHMLGRSVYRLNLTLPEVIVVDEYAEDLDRAMQQLADTHPDGGQPVDDQPQA